MWLPAVVWQQVAFGVIAVSIADQESSFLSVNVARRLPLTSRALDVLLHLLRPAAFVGAKGLRLPEEEWVPVSTSLRCVTALAIVFFGLYIAIVCARSSRLIARCMSGAHVPSGVVERKLTEATENISVTPLLAVTFLGARLRAMRLDPSRGGTDPLDPWVTGSMVASTAALFARAFIELAPVSSAYGLRRALSAARGLSAVVLYVTAG